MRTYSILTQDYISKVPDMYIPIWRRNSVNLSVTVTENKGWFPKEPAFVMSITGVKSPILLW